MNKELQFSEDQQAMEHAKEKNLSILHKMISIFCLIPRTPRPQMNCPKNRRMTHMIQVQGKNQPNQCCHLINHPNLRQNSDLIMKKHP